MPAMDQETQSIYQLGELRFAPSDHRLSRNGEDIHLRPKTFQVLQYLVERHGHLVTKEELLDAVWSETYVNEKVLSRSVWEIREALKKNGEECRLIQTVPKLGYRFVGPVRIAEGHVPEPASRARGRLKALAAGLAVLACAAGLAWWALPQTSEGTLLRAVPLTSDPDFENWPAFSPDGSQVAYQGGADGDPGAIFVKQVGADEALRRTFDPGIDHAASWSPDGRWIAFLRGDALPKGPLRLIVIPPFAGAEREIGQIDAPVGWGFRPAWTPDSRALIVPHREGSRSKHALYRISIENGEKSRLSVPDAGSMGDGDQNPVVSPDGSRLAFTRGRDLHVVDLDARYRPSGRPRALARLGDLGELWGLAWTADSREIVLAAGRWPLARLFRVSASGGGIRPLVSLGAGTFAPAISRDGHRLAYLEWISSSDIWQVRLDQARNVISQPTRLISSSRLDFEPLHSPDGGRIAFHSNRTGTYGIWIASSSGEEARLLQPLGSEGSFVNPGRFSWSPDQSAMVVAAAGDLCVVELRSGRARPLATGPMVDDFPLWSPDGRWVYFSSHRDGLWQVSRIPASGGRSAPVTSDGGSLLAVSPDGLRVFFTRDDRLWMIPAAGGEAVEVLDVAPDFVVATEQGIFHALNGFAHRIEYFDFESGQSSIVLELDRWIMGLSVSPDGRALVYALIDHKRADLMMVEDFE